MRDTQYLGRYSDFCWGTIMKANVYESELLSVGSVGEVWLIEYAGMLPCQHAST